MKTHSLCLKSSFLAAAVSSALIATPARPEDDVVAATTPESSVEIGVGSTSSSSARFGEYNGLDKSGASLVGGFSARGGDAYGGRGGLTRWSLEGSNLGLSSRSLGGTFSLQGRLNLGFRYDELEHNLSDTFQTPYVGSVGGNRFTLPGGFGTSANTNTLNATQLGAFHNLDISSKRKNSSFFGGVNLGPGWDIRVDFNHLDQSGAKLQGFGLSPATVGGPGGEFVSILPMPTNYKTDTVNAAVNWVGNRGNLTAAYFGSYFHNDYDRVTFQSWNQAGIINTMSTPPSNVFHQINLSGGYLVLPKTRLNGNLSYAVNTQDQAFAFDPGLMVTPPPLASPNAKIITTHADGRVINQSIRDLTLTAGFKYDERDNRTPSNIYNFAAISGGNIANYPNTPLSIRKTQFELAGDYRIKPGHAVRLAYNHEDISRWCNNYAVNALYPAGTNCVVAKGSIEDKVDATYRLSAIENFSFRVGYGYSSRREDADPFARAAFIGTNGIVNGITKPGQNAGDFLGFHPFIDASRTQNAVKAGVDWNASEAVSLGLGGRYSKDDYNTPLGMQLGETWSLNLDAAFRYSEHGTLTSYVTNQYRTRDMTDQQRTLASASAATATAIAVPAGATWSDKLTDKDITFGLGARHTGLAGGKLDLTGDLTYSWATSGYTTQFNYFTTTTGGLTCAAPSILSCGTTPDVRSVITRMKLTGTYKIDKQSKIALVALYQHLGGDDYYYNGYQLGFTPTQVLPTNQQLGTHNVGFAAISYIYNF